MSSTRITDEVLTAYLDCELDSHQAAQVEDAMSKYPAVSERLRSLEIVKQDLKPAFDMLLKDAPAAPSFQKRTRGDAPRLFVRVATALAAILVAAAVFLRAYPLDPTEGLELHERIAIYQDLYVYETLSSLSFTEGEKSRQLDFLSDKIGYDLDPFSSIEGLNFVRGQLLGVDGESLAHLSYLSDTGRPIALCAVRMGAPEQSEASVVELLGMTAVKWQDKGYSFVLIGELEPETINSFVTSLG